MKKLASAIILSCLCLGWSATSFANPPREWKPAKTMSKPTTNVVVAAAAATDKPAKEDKTLERLENQNAGAGDDEFKNMKDPLRPWNKIWFHFNDKFALWILRPVATGYGKVVPKPVRSGLKNFMDNVETPIPLVSCLLQGRWKDSGVVAERFGINTTIGILGFRDAATKQFDLDPLEEDTDQAFGRWGLGQGCYIVWPFFGPSSCRGTVGLVGDTLLNPVTWMRWPLLTTVGVTAFDKVNRSSFDPDSYKNLKEGAVDPYVGLRDAYYQNRKKLVSE